MEPQEQFKAIMDALMILKTLRLEFLDVLGDPRWAILNNASTYLTKEANRIMRCGYGVHDSVLAEKAANQ